MDISRAFEVAFNRKIEKNWEKIYVVVDIHDTILHACYENEETYDYYLFLNKMWKIRLTKSWLVGKALIAESIKIFGVGDMVFDDESRHGSPAGLCPYGLNLQVAPLADIK